MLKRRTDLAMEARELWNSSTQQNEQTNDVDFSESTQEGYLVTTVRITGEKGAQALGKPQGTYVTLELAGLKRREEDAFPRAAKALASELRVLLPTEKDASILVVGLGNRAITPDNVGPAAIGHTLVTRHLVEQVPEYFGHFRPVAALAAGVLANTGVESSELVRAVADKIKPSCIIAIDALASRSLQRLCTTIQLADTGITPGSGVGNHRAALDQKSLGVPVIALGVPTVVDVATLCADVLEEAGQAELEPQILHEIDTGLMVTPRDIDQSTADMAKVIGYGINLALHPELSFSDIEMFLN